MEEKEIKICSFCVMDNKSDSSITFNEKGECNYCLDTRERKDKEYFPNEEGKKKLEMIIQEIKENTKNDKYNCLVGISGGVDSSYVLYLGYKYSLRMLVVHIDDDLDTDIAKENIEKLCKAANVDLISIRPDKEEYADIILSFLKAGLPNLAMPQDNILNKELFKIKKKYNIKYSLSGANFSLESILERGDFVNSNDGYHIKKIHKEFGKIPMRKTELTSIFREYIINKFFNNIKVIRPLNYIDYNLKNVLEELKEFCGYQYYGGKHYENVLTRFLQCYYLPKKFNKDKRKSHFSSMIVSGQMTREEALEKLKEDPYINQEIFKSDIEILSKYFKITSQELMEYIKSEAHQHREYKISYFNYLGNIARKYRKFLE